MNTPITAEDLNRLPEASIRAILGNAVMVAQEADPDTPTGRTVLAEIRLHLSRYLRDGYPLPEDEDPEDDDPDPDDEFHCPSGCGRTMERRQLARGTPETGYMVLVCSHCGRVEG